MVAVHFERRFSDNDIVYYFETNKHMTSTVVIIIIE